MTNEMVARVARILAWTNDGPTSGPDIHGWTDKHWQEWEWQARLVIAAVQAEFADVIEYADNYDGDIAGAIRLKFSDALS